MNIRHEPKRCPSVDKNGNPDNSGTTGFGWFPGYAINVETGERLNIMFAENSEDVYNHGNDMIFNPTNVYAFQKDNNGTYILDVNGNPIPMSQDEYNALYSSSICDHEALGEPLYGGRHYVYVCGSSGNTANTFYRSNGKQRNYNDNGIITSGSGLNYGGTFGGGYPYYECGVYDECEWLSEKFKTVLYESYINSTPRKSKKMQIFNNVMWTGIPMPAEGQESNWLANEATVSIRVTRPYMYYSSAVGTGPIHPVNSNAPLFSFSTFDLNVAQQHDFYELSDAMAENDNRIDINNIDASVFPQGGAWFYEKLDDIADYIIPKGSEKSTLFGYSFWMGGIDNDDQLHLFGERYNQLGYDTWPGPLSSVNSSIDEETMLKWNRTFKITRQEVLEFLANYQNPEYEIPQHILEWPAHGDTTKGQAWLLAPFTDMNGDNHYDPTNGDHPDFPGDMAQFVIFNDNYSQHEETQGTPMGVEVHVMVYAYDAPEDSIMNNTLFFDYKIFNRSQNDYHDNYIGLWTDWDLGCADDDYVGCDVVKNTAYCYNGSSTDGSGQYWAYGESWPVQTLTLLTGPYMPADSIDNPIYTEGADCSTFINNGLNEYAINGTSGFGDGITDNERYGLTGFVYSNDNTSVTGDPQIAIDYYNLMRGVWKDNTHIKYGSNGHPAQGASDLDCRFIFPGNSYPCNYNTFGIQTPDTPNYGSDGWTEVSVGNAPYDRRGLSSVGPFNLEAGGMQELSFCMVTIPHEYAVTSTGITLDSLYRVNPNYRSQQFITPIVHNLYQTICEGDSIYFFGEKYSESGVYSHYVFNSSHSNDVADTIYNLHLAIPPTYTFYEASACDSLVWNDSTYNVSGIYTKAFPSENGCDSIEILSLTIYNTHFVENDTTICAEYYWNGQVYYETGTYTYEYTNVLGCVCTDTLRLTVLPLFSDEITVTSCDSYTLEGITYTESGDYTQNSDTLPFRYLYWRWDWANWAYDDEETGFTYPYRPNGWSDVLYAGEADDYYFYDQYGGMHMYNIFTGGIDVLELIHYIPGCKLTTIHLTINNSISESVEATACNSYTWNDSTYTTSGDYTQTFTAVNGCDSVVTLHLTVNYSTTGDTNAVACDSFDWNGETYTQSGDYPLTFTNASGCDSVVTLHLTVNASDHTELTAAACGEYVWLDSTYTESGNYSVTYTNAAGCDSIVTLHLTINPIPEVAITGNTTICPDGGTMLTATGADSYLWSNYSSNASIPVNMFGVYSVTGTTSAGCFSTASVTVLVAQPPVITVTGDMELCAGNTGTITAHGGTTYMWSNGSTDSSLTVSTAGSWQVIGYDENGCNGIASATVTVWQPATSAFTVASCNSYTWNDSVYTQSGDYTQSFQTIHGCDSVVTLHLTVNHSDSTAFYLEVCDSYQWNNETYATSGDYTQTLTNASGCDSVVTLHLTVRNSTTGDTSAVSCESFTWHGNTYTQSGDYLLTLTNATGCDSVVTLHLTINNPVHTAVTETACESFTWNGTEYTVSGDYTYSHADGNGCTQVDTLHLTIFNDESSEFSIVTEDSCYTWNSQTYCASGDYTQTFQTVHGCDSVVTLHLTITVGVDNYDGFDFKVYPNPTSNIVNVECIMKNEEWGEVELHLCDAYGRLLGVIETHGRASRQTAQIDLSQFADGIYFVKAVADGKTVAVRKVVKQ